MSSRPGARYGSSSRTKSCSASTRTMFRLPARACCAWILCCRPSSSRSIAACATPDMAPPVNRRCKLRDQAASGCRPIHAHRGTSTWEVGRCAAFSHLPFWRSCYRFAAALCRPRTFARCRRESLPDAGTGTATRLANSIGRRSNTIRKLQLRQRVASQPPPDR